MTAEQLQHFKNITLDYFMKLAGDASPPEFSEAFIQFAEPVTLDYISLISISGPYEGCIYMTTEGSILDDLLHLHGEVEISERTRMDMCRELSNVLAGNAMHVFGEEWQISVPQSMGRDAFTGINLPPSIFIMPISWRSGQSYLAIGCRWPKGSDTSHKSLSVN